MPATTRLVEVQTRSYIMEACGRNEADTRTSEALNPPAPSSAPLRHLRPADGHRMRGRVSVCGVRLFSRLGLCEFRGSGSQSKMNLGPLSL